MLEFNCDGVPFKNMSKLIVANWKMNPATYAEAGKLVRGILKSLRKGGPKVVLCPPFTWLTDFSHKMRHHAGLSWGGQDIFWEDKGAFTGEISPRMLKSSGVTYVIVGHSERRRWLGETDEMISKKVLAALRAGLKVILCVGEPMAIRKKGIAAAKRYIASQLLKDLKLVASHGPLTSALIIAYEPIWAIGTGRADKPEEAAAMAIFIKRTCAAIFKLRDLRVLYGGSVNSRNTRNFLQYKETDGALVGGASFMVGEFKKIVNIASGI